jgi:hypothetical protein
VSRFKEGDRVVANKSVVATIEVYDETVGRVVLVQDLGNGATNRIYGPVESYDLELLVSDAVTERPAEVGDAERAVIDLAKGDEFTTLDTLS